MHTQGRVGVGDGLRARARRVDRWGLLLAAAVLFVVTGTVRGIVRNLEAGDTLPPEPPQHSGRPLALAPR